MSNAETLHFVTKGKHSNPPLMLLHGFLGSSQDWGKVLNSLSDSFYCIAVDLPFHGDSLPLPARENAFQWTAESLIKIIQLQNVKNCHLLGYSLGGRVAMYAAVEQPQFWATLIIESAHPGLENSNDREARLKWDDAISKRLNGGDLASFLQFWYNQPIFDSLSKHPKFELMLQRRLQINQHMAAEAIRAFSLGTQPSLWQSIASSKHPMLFLAGELDQKYRTIAEKFRRRPQTMIEIIPGCGHNIHFENSSVFCKKVKEFLTEI